MEKWKKRAVELMASLALGDRQNLGVVPYYPQKTKINMPEKRFFARTSPEKQGVSSKRIYNMLCALESERHANIHTILVIRHGNIISECSSKGYSTNGWHISHSMAKTVCGMIVGTLIDEGRLRTDDLLIDIFPELEYRDKRFSSITVDHLLSMTAGVDFAEAGAVTEGEWTKAFFSANLKFQPGAKFAYNSMNSYILARICERVSGESFERLSEERIFRPLEIKNYFWEKSPEGTEKGGWGLYLSAESWAKLGVLIASGGVFLGKRILSREWVENSTAVKAIADDFHGGFNYAYHIWTSKSGNEYLFNGMLGQNVWICPKNDIIVVMLSGNNEMFGDSPALDIVRKYLGGKINDRLDRRDLRILREKERDFFGCRRWITPRERGEGWLYKLGIKKREAFDERWNRLIGRYKIADNAVGMMPLLVRTMQNNHTSPIEEICIVREGESLFLRYIEGGELFSLRIGLYGYESNLVNLRGEYYIVQAMGRAIEGYGGETQYRIEMILSETASVRRLTVRKNESGITVELGESPGNRVVEGIIDHYSKENRLLSMGGDIIERRFGEGTVSELLKRLFNPTIVGADLSLPECDEIIEKENIRRAEEQKKLRGIRGLVDRFFSDEGAMERERQMLTPEKTVKKALADWLKRMREKIQN